MESRRDNHPESGNILFLILIAVALFAALTYATTWTGRNGNDTNDTVDTVDASEINQFPTGVHFAVMRMKVGGLDETRMEFNAPEDFDDLSSPEVGVFHPDGGGVTYVTAPASLMADGTQSSWIFNGEFEVEDIGINVLNSFDGNDMIAFLPNIKRSACTRINSFAEIAEPIPNSTSDLSGSYTINMDNTYSVPVTEVILGPAGSNGTDGLLAKPFGCFQNNSLEYVYYQVIKNR